MQAKEEIAADLIRVLHRLTDTDRLPAHEINFSHANFFKVNGISPLLTFTDLQLLVLFVLFDSRRCYSSLLAWRNRVSMEVPVLQTMMMTHTNAFVKQDLLGTIAKQVSKSNLRYLLLSLELYFTTSVHFEMTSLWFQMEDNDEAVYKTIFIKENSKIPSWEQHLC